MSDSKRAYFLSDFHLGARYIKDKHAYESRIVKFLDSIKDSAHTVYLLGDVLDYWYEYRYVVPRGFVRFFGKIAELTDMGIRVVWFIGNHDIWIFDYLPAELGVEVVDGALVERIGDLTVYMTHGDGVGRIEPKLKVMRRLFRNKFCQKLFSAIHPRWTVPFAFGWSSKSREYDRGDLITDPKNENLVRFAEEFKKTHPEIDCFIFGHRHSPYSFDMGDDCKVIILGAWLDGCSYATISGGDITFVSSE